MSLRRFLSVTVLSYPKTTLALAVILTLVSVQVTIRRLSYTSTHEALAPASGRVGQIHEQYNRAFGGRDRVVIVIEANDREQAKRFAAELAGRLKVLAADVEEVIYRFDLKSLEDHFLMYLSPQELIDVKGKLEEHRVLLDELSADPGLNRLLQLIQREISKALVGHLFTGFLEEERETKRPVELGPLIALLEQLNAWAKGPRAYTSPWSRFFVEADESGDREGYLWSEDKRFLLILATVKADAKSLLKFQGPIERIRREVRTLLPRYPGLKAGVTGGPALEHDEVVAAQRDSGLMAIISLSGVILLLVVVFRGVARPLMGAIALVMGVCWAFGFAAITVGHLNMLSVVLAPLLIGIGMDYGIFLLTRYEEERSAGHSISEALGQAIEGAGPGILHAAMTTSVALFTLTLTGIGVLRELGVIAGCGLLLTVVSTFVVLPPLLVLWDKRRVHESVAPRSLSPAPPAFLKFWYRRPRTVLALSAGVTIVALYAMSGIEFDGNVLRLQSEGTESVAWELKLIRNSERSISYGVILARTFEEVREKTRALEALPSVSAVESLAMLIPEDQKHKLRLVQELRPILSAVNLQEAHPLPPVDLEGLRTTLQRINAKMLSSEEGKKWAAKDGPPLEMMARVRRLIEKFEGLLTQRDQELIRRRLSAYQVKLFQDFREKVGLLSRAVASGPVQLDELPTDLKKQFVGRDGSYLLRVYARENPWELASQAAFVHDLRTVDPDAVGDPVKGYEIITAMKRAYQKVGIYALVGVAILFLLNLRDLRYFLLAHVPLLVGAVWTAGLMQLFQIKFNLANLIIIPLIVAPGVENGLLIIHRFREEAEATVLPRSMVKGVALSSLTTMVGFGSLMISHHRGAFSVGLLVTLGVASVLVVSIVVLPALLTIVAKRPSHTGEKPHAETK